MKKLRRFGTLAHWPMPSPRQEAKVADPPRSVKDIMRIKYLDDHTLVETNSGTFFLFEYDKPSSGRPVTYHWWEPSKMQH